jgi:hypothetical protein
VKAEVSPSVNAVPEPSLRYFVYVSDTKLNNLFDQISPKLRQRLSAEAKVDLKLASLTVKEAQSRRPPAWPN